MSDLEAVLTNIEPNLDAAYERALLRIRSVSTDLAYAEECRACAKGRKSTGLKSIRPSGWSI